MIVHEIQFFRLQIPMQVRFAQANAQSICSDSMIIQIKTKGGTIGFGEACPRKYVTGESPDSLVKDLQQTQSLLFQQNFRTLKDIQNFINESLPDELGLAAQCGLELALLDAWSREYQEPLIQAMAGMLNASPHYTGILPMGNLDKLRPVLQRFQFREIKIKVGQHLQENVKRIQWIRNLLGKQMPIRVDANCAWDYDMACKQIPALLEAGTYCIEQPLAKGMEAAMARLCKAYGAHIEIMADESLTSWDAAQQLVDLQAANRFNLKISKNGGIFQSLQLYQLAQRHGLNCQLGAHFGETSILTAAGLLLSSLAPNLAAIEGAMGEFLLAKDLCNPVIQMNESGRIPQHHAILNRLGLSGDIRPEVLEQYAVEK